MSDYESTREAAGKVTTRYEKMLRDLTDEHARADRIEELEARLAKAVETLEYYNVAGYEGKEARTTLAELKGQNDE